jgi:hypothetical protein
VHGCFVTLICIVHGRRLADQQRKKKLAAQTKADIKRQKAIEAKAVEAEKEAQRASELKLRLQLEVIREEDQLKQVVKDEEQAQTALGKAMSTAQDTRAPPLTTIAPAATAELLAPDNAQCAKPQIEQQLQEKQVLQERCFEAGAEDKKATSLTQKDATPMVQKHAQTALDRAMSTAQDKRAPLFTATAPAAAVELPTPDEAPYGKTQIKQPAKHPKPHPKPYAKNAPAPLQQHVDVGVQDTQGGAWGTPSTSFYSFHPEACPPCLSLPLSPGAKGGVGPAPPPPTHLFSANAKDPQVSPDLIGRHCSACLQIHVLAPFLGHISYGIMLACLPAYLLVRSDTGQRARDAKPHGMAPGPGAGTPRAGHR